MNPEQQDIGGLVKERNEQYSYNAENSKIICYQDPDSKIMKNADSNVSITNLVW